MVEEEETATEDEEPVGDDWATYPWRRAVVASHDRDDLDSWPCPACKHPLAFHAFHASTPTNAFAKAHGQDYRFACDAWLFVEDGVGSLAEPGDEMGSCACTFHGIVGGADWPDDYRPLYRFTEVNPDTFNRDEEPVEMRAEDWRDYQPATLDRWGGASEPDST